MGDLHPPLPDADTPRAGVRVRRRRRLHSIASTQAGYFTVADTAAAGYDRRARHHHLGYGNWRRTAAPGVYRLAGFPRDPAEPLRAWLLWGGSDASLTAWSGLHAHGLDLEAARRAAIRRTADVTPADLAAADPTPADPEGPDGLRPVELIRPGSPRLRDQDLRIDPEVLRIHRYRVLDQESLVIDGRRVRPLTECLCAALQTSVGPAVSAAALLTEQLLDSGALFLQDLLLDTWNIGAPRMLDLLWPRLSSAA